MSLSQAQSPFEVPNVRLFIYFRLLFNSRFYYPVFAVLFLDFGLSLEQFAILNAVWAGSIVLFEIPSGAMADTIGRVNLVRYAAILMVLELLLLCFAPLGGGTLVFNLFLLNRILSGMAEAAASGADEALAYDSLKVQGDGGQWGRVLEVLMRWQSVSFVIAMTLGAFMYDDTVVNSVLGFCGIASDVDHAKAMRIPLFGTLLLSFLAVVISFRMKEVSENESSDDSTANVEHPVREAFAKAMSAGKWILNTPIAFSIIMAGFLFDHVIRMILTINSEYYRLIEIPDACFGIIGSLFAFMGIFVPKLGRVLADKKSRGFNYILVGILVFFGFLGMSYFIPYYGVLPVLLLSAAFSLTGYFVSYYLNEVTESSRRATVLSFKSLSYNVSYGLIGILYAILISQLRTKGEIVDEDALFIDAFQWFLPYYTALFLLIAVVSKWRLSRQV